MTIGFAITCVLLAAAPRPALGERLEAGPSDGHVVVHVRKAGLFSAFAHDHRFEVTGWHATADLPDGDPREATLLVVLSAASLRDTEPGLSDADRRKVDAQAASREVLDAADHPRIEFRSERIDVGPSAAASDRTRGTLRGILTIRGRSVRVDVPFQAERAKGSWRVNGTARVNQSALGIRPFSGFGGTVKVKDELTVEFAFTLTTRATPSRRAGTATGTGSSQERVAPVQPAP